MVANASAHRLRIFVGSEDWSRQLVSFDAGQDQRSDSGILFTTGTLVLAQTAGVPGSLNPRSANGKERWWRGQRVTIDATDSTGNFVRHRFGWLYIVKALQPPTDGLLTLELGCILTLRNFVQPDEDKSEIRYPTDGSQPPLVDRRTIVNRLLTAAGVPNCVDGINFPLQTPQAKQGGSFVEQAGKLAYAAGKYLYQNSLGQIRAVNAAFPGGEAAIVVTIGRDEITYQPYEGSETPSEIIKAVGVKTNLISNYGTEESYTEEYGINTVNGETSTVVARTIQVKETINVFGRVREETVRAWASTVAPAFYGAGNISLVLDSFTKEEQKFLGSGVLLPVDGGGTAPEPDKLREVRRLVLRLFVAACADYYEQIRLAALDDFNRKTVNALEEITRYTYTPEDLLRETNREVFEPKAAIIPDEMARLYFQFPNTGVSRDVTLSETEKITYSRVNPRIGKRVTQRLAALAREYPEFETLPSVLIPDEIRIKLSLIGREFRTETSTTGQLNPPAAERAIEPFTEEEEPLECEARFSLSPFITANQERERTIQVDGGIVNKQQLCQIAQIRGLEIIGLAQGQTFQLPLYDVFLNEGSPFMLIDSIEPDGTILRFLTNGIQISHDPNQAIVGFTGIWIGTAQIGQPDRFIPPYESVTTSAPLVIPRPALMRQDIIGGAKSGGFVTILPYEPQTYSENRVGGSRAGGRFTVITGELVTAEMIPVTSGGDEVFVEV